MDKETSSLSDIALAGMQSVRVYDKKGELKIFIIKRFLLEVFKIVYSKLF